MLTANIKASVASTLSANVDAAVNGLSGNIVWTPLGARGVGIASIQKTATEGLVDTYTITYTDGYTTTYQMRNGETGKNGATFTPHVDEDGNLSWSNDGGLENPPEVNVRGPEGPKNYAPRLWMVNEREGYTQELLHMSWLVGAEEATRENVNVGDLVMYTMNGTVRKITTIGRPAPAVFVGEIVATITTGTTFTVDNHTLKLEGGVMRVNTAPSVEQDNTLPITSAAVFAEVGNINALLATI